MNRTAVLLSALALSALPAGAALAQLAPASNAPIDISGDQLVAQNQLCVATWKGAVEARQGTSRLRADTLSIYEKVGAGPSQPSSVGAVSGKCGSDPQKLVADGSVYYATPQEVVKGDHAVYLAETKTITVTGDVVISQGKNVIVGNTLVIDTDTGQATMESTAKGRGTPGRVRAVIFPSGNQAGGLFPSTPARP
jgi:lipopolysaccharide export system protein LptA